MNSAEFNRSLVHGSRFPGPRFTADVSSLSKRKVIFENAHVPHPPSRFRDTCHVRSARTRNDPVSGFGEHLALNVSAAGGRAVWRIEPGNVFRADSRYLIYGKQTEEAFMEAT